jgi:Uma2 family endonuclease
MATQPKIRLTPEEYLEIERKAEFKSEYYQGEMFAMSGATEAHNTILFNLAGVLYPQLRKRPRRGYSNDQRVRVDKTGLYTYPDMAVVCGERVFAENRKDTLLNPTVLIEVLSPSTEAYDRGRKFDHYRSIESLREYLMISSDRVHADHYVRQPDGNWLLTAKEALDQSLDLQSIECRLLLADLYEKVDLPPAE